MLIQIANIISNTEVTSILNTLKGSEWQEGAKIDPSKNDQFAKLSQAQEQELGGVILTALSKSSVFGSFVMPNKISNIIYSKYSDGEYWAESALPGIFVNNAQGFLLRPDLEAFVFLSDKKSFEGGELIVKETNQTHTVSPEQGTIVIFKAGTRREIAPVSKGTSFVASFSIQSLIRNAEDRETLFTIDSTVQDLVSLKADNAVRAKLMSVYHTLLKKWAE